MKTYLFYDIETSGLNPAFDQVLTFACIRTDLEFNEINRQTITIQLRKDIVPSPGAFLTHGLTYDELALGISEYAAARQIHALLNTPGTISIGYNSLGFDDVFLRFMFYRNLLDPYLHQYRNGCSRMDILPIAVVFRVFHPTGLTWPHIDGKPSLKLDLIARENQFVTSGRAHEAMNDVEALLGLSKKLAQQTDIWRYCLDFFNKTRDDVRINRIENGFHIQSQGFKVGLMVSTSFGSKVNFMAPVVHLGYSLPYKNQTLWLRLDSDDILGRNVDVKETFVIRKRPGDALIVLPALERFWHKLPRASQQSANDNIERICRHWESFFDVIQYHRTYKYPFVPNMDPDAALYQEGFFSAREKRQIDLFHKTRDCQKQDLVTQMKTPRIRILAHRILARNFERKADQTKETEDPLLLNRLRSSREEDQIIGYKNDMKLNCQRGFQELKELEQSLIKPNQDQINMLSWLKAYIEKQSISPLQAV